jgi:lysyl-tRNA synthetase class 1
MREFLQAVADAAEANPPNSGDSWQDLIFRVAVAVGMGTNRRSFAAIYAAFLGRENGPRAGWLLASEDPSFVINRLREAGAA